MVAIRFVSFPVRKVKLNLFCRSFNSQLKSALRGDGGAFASIKHALALIQSALKWRRAEFSSRHQTAVETFVCGFLWWAITPTHLRECVGRKIANEREKKIHPFTRFSFNDSGLKLNKDFCHWLFFRALIFVEINLFIPPGIIIKRLSYSCICHLGWFGHFFHARSVGSVGSVIHETSARIEVRISKLGFQFSFMDMMTLEGPTRP